MEPSGSSSLSTPAPQTRRTALAVILLIVTVLALVLIWRNVRGAYDLGRGQGHPPGASVTTPANP